MRRAVSNPREEGMNKFERRIFRRYTRLEEEHVRSMKQVENYYLPKIHRALKLKQAQKAWDLWHRMPSSVPKVFATDALRQSGFYVSQAPFGLMRPEKDPT